MDIKHRGVLTRILTMILTSCLGLTAVILAAGVSSGVSTDVASDHLASTTTFSEGAGPQAYVPALRVIGGQTSDVEGWVEIQNVGSQSVLAVLTYWVTAENCAGSLQGSQHSDMLPPGASWRWTTADLPEWVQSAKAEAYTDLPANGGEPTSVPLAVAVGRSAPSPAEGSIHPLFTSYVAIPPSGLGIPGDAAQYEVVVSGIYADFEGHNSWLNIQNAGDSCADVVMEFSEHAEDCLPTTTCEIMGLALGEARNYDVGACLAAGFRGSVRILSSQPVAAVADTIISGSAASSHVATPANVVGGEAVQSRIKLYGTVHFSQQPAWETSLFVQNLSHDDKAKVKAYFRESHGDIIKTVVEWISPHCSTVIPLSEVDGLPSEQLQQVMVESQEWWTPGERTSPQPIVAAAHTTHYTDPSQSQVLSQVGYGLGGVTADADAIALPWLSHEFSDPTLPITNALTSKVVISYRSWPFGAKEVALDLLDEGCVRETITKTVEDGQIAEIKSGRCIDTANRLARVGNRPVHRNRTAGRDSVVQYCRSGSNWSARVGASGRVSRRTLVWELWFCISAHLSN